MKYFLFIMMGTFLFIVASTLIEERKQKELNKKLLEIAENKWTDSLNTYNNQVDSMHNAVDIIQNEITTEVFLIKNNLKKYDFKLLDSLSKREDTLSIKYDNLLNEAIKFIQRPSPIQIAYKNDR